jgi:hypothetical protein
MKNTIQLYSFNNYQSGWKPEVSVTLGLYYAVSTNANEKYSITTIVLNVTNWYVNKN